MEDKYFLKENDFLGILKDKYQKLYGIIKVNSHLILTPDLLIQKESTSFASIGTNLLT